MFDPQAYGPEIASILGLPQDEARETIHRSSNLPNLVRTGLYNYFGCWKEAHELAQDIETRDGSYWHGILHRQEPDPGNASYWFRQVGDHPIFPRLRDRALQCGYNAGPRWDPFAFIHYADGARSGSTEAAIARAVEKAEWELLFDYCAGAAKAGAKETS